MNIIGSDKIRTWLTSCLALSLIFSLNAFADTSEKDVSVSVDEDADKICISEVMFKNHAAILDCDGEFSDWIELYNTSDTAVNLSGWALSDNAEETKWTFPEVEIESGQYLLVFASGKDLTEPQLHTNFSVSAKETVFLLDKTGNVADSMSCSESKHDVSWIHGDDGCVSAAHFTPGYANTDEGYLEFIQTLNSKGPLQINEVLVRNSGYGTRIASTYSDLVEIKNISDTPVNLSDYYMSKDHDDPTFWNFPDKVLNPGKILLIYCDTDIEGPTRFATVAPFNLSSKEEHLYLTSSEGEIIDYVYLNGIPLGGSYGRMQDENGWFYFSNPNPENPVKRNGRRLVSKQPVPSLAPGVYPDIKELNLELQSEGTIYYTLDGSAPSIYSTKYTVPIYINNPVTLRAIAVEENGIQSPVLTAGYIIGVDHKLPVLCMVGNEPYQLRGIYGKGLKDQVVLGNISFYDGDNSFSMDCGIEMKGWTSLNDPKKSFGITFKGRYGSDTFDYDLFGNGVVNYTSLNIRAGQDYPLSVIKDEVAQEICYEMTDSVYTQQSRYCVLYMNGRYMGIYCIKDNLSEANFAAINGVSKDDVQLLRSPVSTYSEFYMKDMGRFMDADMTVPETYEEFCKVFDVNSLIDWFILEGYFVNTDVNGNLKYVYSPVDGLWKLVFYDLDWTFNDPNICFTNVAHSAAQLAPLYEHLFLNENFRRALLARYSELSKTYLSDEHVIEVIDMYASQIASEMDRERTCWGGLVSSWERNIEKLKNFIIENDYCNYSIDCLCWSCGATEEEKIEFFG